MLATSRRLSGTVSFVALNDRRFFRWSSGLAILAACTVAAIAVVAIRANPFGTFEGPVRSAGTEQLYASPRCREVDRANVARLTAILERNGPADAPILERAIATLNTARRHCFYGWDGRGLKDYESLGGWLSEQRGDGFK